MTSCYHDYFWLKGVPKGYDCLQEGTDCAACICYKIVDDPYRKRFSIERYEKGRFATIVYDSLLLDFRHIKPAEQQGWSKETTTADEDSVTCVIRNQDDRIIYIETHAFEADVCRECQIFSPQGLFLAINRMFYKSKGDATDGVVLFDRQDKPVMYKLYETGEDGQFTDLIEERWDLTDLSEFRKSFPIIKATRAGGR